MSFFLHGGGERGSDNQLQVTGQTAGPFALAREEIQTEFPSFVAVPQMDNFPAGWVNSNVHGDVLDIIHALSQEFNIDSNRIHVTGNSMGGAGTVYYMQNDGNIFATGVPVCPWFEGGNPDDVSNAMDKPMWFFHGGADQVASPGNSKNLVDEIRNAGYFVNHSVFPNVNHDSWNMAYGDPDYPRWVLTKSLEWEWPVKDGKLYRIINVNSEHALELENNSELIQRDLDLNNPNQIWNLENQENGYYKIVNENSGLLLESDGDNVSAGNSNNNESQLWLMWEIGNRFKIVPKLSHMQNQNRTLGFPGDSKLSGEQCILSEYMGQDSQRFSLMEVKEEVYVENRASSNNLIGKLSYMPMVGGAGQHFFKKILDESKVGKIFDLNGRSVSIENLKLDGLKSGVYILKTSP